MLTCGKITIIFPDWHSHDSLLTFCDTICHPVTPPLSDGEGYPTGKSVMYPIPHVFSLALSQSRIHAFTHGGTVAFLCSSISPFTRYRTHTWMIEVPNTCCGKITNFFPDWHSYGSLLTVCDTICHPVTPLKCPAGSVF